MLQIQDALFSEKLVENKQKLKMFSLSTAKVNEEIENEKIVFEKTKKGYYEELRQCLKSKNGKYCKAIHGNSTIELYDK